MAEGGYREPGRGPHDSEFNNYELCPVCYGWGKVNKEPKQCFACKGRGQMTREEFRQMRGVIKMIRTGDFLKLRPGQWPRGQALPFARPWLGPPEMVKRAIHTERLYELDCVLMGCDNRRGWILDWTELWDGVPARNIDLPGQVLNNNEDIVSYLNPTELERFRIVQQQKRLEMEERRARAAHEAAEQDLRRCREVAEEQRREAEARIKANKASRPIGKGRGMPLLAGMSTLVLAQANSAVIKPASVVAPAPPKEIKYILVPAPKPATSETAAQTELEETEEAVGGIPAVEEIPRSEEMAPVINIHVSQLVVGAVPGSQQGVLHHITEAMRRRRIPREPVVEIPSLRELELAAAILRRLSRLMPRFDNEDSE